LPSEPRRAVVRVSADARYTLYVNGVRVHQGPARSFPEHQSYDTLDLTDLLRAGKNSICAILHQFDVPTFFSVYRDAYAFVLDGEIEHESGAIPIHTPEDWLCRPAKGWRKDVVRLTIQLGFQEHFDADADPAEWMSPEFDATEEGGWLPLKHSAPVGSHPWLYPEPRGIPLLAQHEHDLSAVVAQ